MHSTKALLTVTLFLATSSWLTPTGFGADLDQWSEVYPRPTRANLSDVASDGSTWVAVGNPGTILVSPDGDHWSRAVITPPVTRSIRSVAAAAGRWVAVGDRGMVLSSTDGITWVSSAAATTENFNAVTYGRDRFIAVGSYGLIASSTNGVDWKLETTTSTFAPSYQTVTFGNGLFVAGGLNSLQTSADGSAWGAPISLGHDVQSLFFDGERFLAGRFGGVLFTSQDATNWVVTGGINSSNIRKFVKFGENWFAAAGGFFQSSDLTNWVEAPTGAYASNSGGGVFGVASISGKLVIVGEAGNVLSSNDGSAFHQSSQGRPLPLGLVMSHNGRTIVTASSGLLQLDSLDGFTWTERPFGRALFLARDVVSDGQQIVVVGATPIGSTIYNEARTSSDGINWTSRDLKSRGGMNGVAKASGSFVAVGNGGLVYSSTDGALWISNSVVGKPNLAAIATDGSRFVAVGPAGTNYYSDNPSQWTSTPSGAPSVLTSVAWGSGVFVAVGNNGAMVISTNGVAWSALNSGVSGAFRKIIYTNGQFFAVGVSGLSWSPDGKSWTKSTNAPADLQQVCAGTGGVFASNGGSVWREGELPNYLTIAPDGVAGEGTIGIQSPVNAVMRVESSSGFSNWTVVQEITNRFGFTEFKASLSSSNTFFRTVKQ